MTVSSDNVEAIKEELQLARMDILNLLDRAHCNPLLLRLAWHDAGCFDKSKEESWPCCGGATGSIRFHPELGHAANSGLNKGLKYLQVFKDRYPLVSWADLIQLAGALAVEQAGGPHIQMRYGRQDASSPSGCAPDGNLPAAAGPFADGSKTAAEHLRKVFERQGRSDQEIVALSGAHTIGRGFKSKSGVCSEDYGSGTKYTGKDPQHCPCPGVQGLGAPGGRSWTPHWLKFDNSYFRVLLESESKPDPDLLRLETDLSLLSDPQFRPFVEKYAESQSDFFTDYADAHAKLSEQGAMFKPEGGITM